jgi:hypothetical protein
MLGLSISMDDMAGTAEGVVDGVQQGLVEAGRAGFKRSQEEVPVDTGALKESGELKVFRDGPVTFRYTADYALLVERGTDPHEITPSDAEVLVFEGDDGETVFTSMVEHPGTDPQPYAQPGFEAMARELRQRGLSASIDGELGSALK